MLVHVLQHNVYHSIKGNNTRGSAVHFFCIGKLAFDFNSLCLNNVNKKKNTIVLKYGEHGEAQPPPRTPKI